MTLTIALPGERTAALAAIARTKDLTVEEYARQLLEQDLAPDWLLQSWKSAVQAGLDQLSMDEIDAEIAAVRTAKRSSGR